MSYTNGYINGTGVIWYRIDADLKVRNLASLILKVVLSGLAPVIPVCFVLLLTRTLVNISLETSGASSFVY